MPPHNVPDRRLPTGFGRTVLFSVVLLALSGAANSQTGWSHLPNTTLQAVCPPDFFGGQNYEFSYHCPNVINAWSGGIADTARNRLIIWGGGHDNYYGNEIYSLNLNGSPATLIRLTDPSPINVDPTNCPAVLLDGKPNSRETFNSMAYLAHVDRMFVFGGGLACPDGLGASDTWTLNLNSLQWKRMDPVNGSPLPSDCGNQCNVYSIADYDPNSRTVFLAWQDTLWRYTYETNSYVLLNPDAHVPYTAAGVIDPKRKLFIFMGHEYLDATPHVAVIDISPGSTYQVQDWTGTVTGCAMLATGCNDADACFGDYSGLAYDRVLDRTVGWPGAGNTVYLFNPDTKSCTARTFSGSPENAVGNGTFGRFRYFPNLNRYANVTDAALNSVTLTLR
jgi:hypothetical protein